MKSITSLAALVAAAFLSTPSVAETIASPARPTTKCNPYPKHWDRIYLRYAVATDDPLILAMIAAVRDPASNPALYERMGAPKAIELLHIIDATMRLIYDDPQDIEEMTERFRADTELASRFRSIQAGVGFSDFPTQAPVLGPIREYYNASLNHFYLSSTPEEITWLDAGGGGGGWVRTGQSWSTQRLGFPGGFSPDYKSVYMFQGTPGIGPNSHYFTISPEECGYLRRTVGWSYVAVPFGALPPTNGQCPATAPVGLQLLYNNRAAQNDSNHRYTSDPAIYAQMQAQGWTGYGVALCVKAIGAP
ncbi:hypothetical protein [Usitatibacter palustris]|nr:hypothetical protein [Usitatibacter palustris]